MRSLLFLLTFLLLTVIQVQAQTQYQLRQPSAEEYLQAVPAILPLMESGRYVLEAEIAVRYPDVMWLDFELVEQTYDAFVAVGASNIPDLKRWIPIRVISWLTTNDITLKAETIAVFDDAEIDLTPVDLDADGQDEWIVRFTSDAVDGVMFIRLSAEGRYEPISLAYRVGLYGAETSDFLAGNMQIIASEDFTQDNVADVALLSTAEFESYGVDGFRLFTYRNEMMVEVSDATPEMEYQSIPPVWEVLNLDEDPALEIRQISELKDNWDCEFTRITTFDWRETVFTAVDHERTFPESTYCSLRQAEVAMWAVDYDTAIEFYEVYLESAESYQTQYATFRMALAHVLSGRLDQGIAQLQQLQAEQAGKVDRTLLPLINQVLNAYAENPTPFAVCLAAYDYFAFNAYTVWVNEYLEIGDAIDNKVIYERRGEYSPLIPLPDRAGCDLPGLLDKLLAKTVFTTESSPIDQLTVVEVVTGETYHDDLNEDGIQDWVVFLPTIQIFPMFFLSGDDTYILSRPAIANGYPLNQQNTLTKVNLPDNAGVALLNVDYSLHHETYPLGYGIGGGPGSCNASGRLAIWELVGEGLTRIFGTSICDVMPPDQTVNDLNEVREIYGWGLSIVLDDYISVTYVWDNERQSFVLSHTAEMTVTPPATYFPPRFQFPSPVGLYLRNDLDELIEYYNKALAEDFDPLDPGIFEWRYVTALAFEALNRSDEALAEYVAIYESAPESTWGMLAALHIVER